MSRGDEAFDLSVVDDWSKGLKPLPGFSWRDQRLAIDEWDTPIAILVGFTWTLPRTKDREDPDWGAPLGEILARFDGNSGTVGQSLISHHEAFDDSATDLLNDLQWFFFWHEEVETSHGGLLGAASVCGKPSSGCIRMHGVTSEELSSLTDYWNLRTNDFMPKIGQEHCEQAYLRAGMLRGLRKWAGNKAGIIHD